MSFDYNQVIPDLQDLHYLLSFPKVWTTGKLFKYTEDVATSCCLLGGADLVTGKDYSRYKDIVNILYRYLPPTGNRQQVPQLAVFNDQQSSAKPVTDLIELAIFCERHWRE